MVAVCTIETVIPFCYDESVLKLSKLQKWILRAALDALINKNCPMIFYSEVKEGYFGLRRSHTDTQGWKFAKRSTPGYNAANTSLSRAAHRLQQRHLVTVDASVGYSQDTAIAPTTEGFAVAALTEKETPSAFGFDPIAPRRLKEIIEKSKRMSHEDRERERMSPTAREIERYERDVLTRIFGPDAEED